MTRRRRTALLLGGCCLPLVLATCGADDAADPVDQPVASSPVAGGSSPAPGNTASSTTATPTTASPVTSSPSEPPEAAMPTIDRPSTPEPSKPSTTIPSAPPVTPSAPPVTPSTSSTSSNVEIATADLRTRVGEDIDIEVVSHEEVTWPDGGLGCPDPDMSYTQALVNGERIVLRANGLKYEYHSGANRAAFYCPPNRVTPPATGSYGDV